MVLAISGGITAVVGVILMAMGYTQGQDVSYQLQMAFTNDTDWAQIWFICGIALTVIGALLFIVGVVQMASNPQGSTHNTSEPLLGGRDSDSRDGVKWFLQEAKPEYSAADLNVLWYRCGLDRRYPAATKELLWLVQQERKNGKSEYQNELFISRIKNESNAN